MCKAGIGVVGDLCRALNGSIAPYCPTFMEALKMVAYVSIECGVLACDSRGVVMLSPKVAMCCSAADSFLMFHTHLVQSAEVDESVKPLVLSAFSDVAAALGPNFLQFAPLVMDILPNAIQLCNTPIEVGPSRTLALLYRVYGCPKVKRRLWPFAFVPLSPG